MPTAISYRRDSTDAHSSKGRFSGSRQYVEENRGGLSCGAASSRYGFSYRRFGFYLLPLIMPSHSKMVFAITT